MPYQLDHIDPTKTAMIVVDMQNDFVAEGAKLRSAAAAAMVPRLASTLAFCREKGIRVIYTAHVHRHDGSDMGLYDDLRSLDTGRRNVRRGDFPRPHSGHRRAHHQEASL